MAAFAAFSAVCIASAARGDPPAAAGRTCKDAPEDWAAACVAGDLLFLEDDCALCVQPANRRPEIGNGFLAIQMAAEVLPPAGGWCKPGTYVVSDGGCYNGTVGAYPGFTTVKHPGELNSWAVAAETCNSHGYGYAGATDGEGKEIMCSSSPPTFPRVVEGADSKLADTCRKPCPGNTSETCGNDWMLRLVNYTCERVETAPIPQMPVTPSGPLYLAGVFNGCGTKTCKMNPSQRAAISPPLPMHVLGHGKAIAALDLVGASYTRRYAGERFDAQLRMYAHRSRRNLLVTEVTATQSDGTSVVRLGGSFGSHPSGDSFDWNVSTAHCASGDCTVWIGTTREAEIGVGKVVTVAVVFDALTAAAPSSCSRRSQRLWSRH